MSRRLSGNKLVGIELAFGELAVDGLADGELTAAGSLGALFNGELAWVRAHFYCCSQW